MQTKSIQFTGAFGDTLSGRVEHSDQNLFRAYALFAHCFTCSKNLKVVEHITSSLAEMGITTLRFDFTGLGESDGEFANTNFSSNVDDLVAAAKFMKEELEAPSLLIGHSLGGAAVIHAALQLSTVKAVATIGAPADPTHVKENFSMHLEEIEETGEATVKLAGRSFKIKKQFLDDLKGTTMEVENLGKALLIMHAPKDNTVGIDNAAKLYEKAKHPKSFLSLHEADHLLTNENYSKYAGKMIAQWSDIYL